MLVVGFDGIIVVVDIFVDDISIDVCWVLYVGGCEVLWVEVGVFSLLLWGGLVFIDILGVGGFG